VYQKKYALKDLLIAAIWGFILNLSLYALFPEAWRASRMLLVLSFLWVILYAVLSRLALNRILRKSWAIGTAKGNHILVIGDAEELEKVRSLMKKEEIADTYQLISVAHLNEMGIEQWSDFIRIHAIQEIVFCQNKMEWKQILYFMSNMKDLINYKIMTASGSGIISSPSKNNQGEILSLELEYNLSKTVYLRQKRLFDLGFSLMLLVFSWIVIFIFKNKRQFLKNLNAVILGKKTWVSYQRNMEQLDNLPLIKQGILFPILHNERIVIKELEAQLLSMYAWNYSTWTDLDICLRNFHKLDQN